MHMEIIQDADLWSAVLRGNRNAFARIVDRYKSLVCAVTYSITGDIGLSEDVAQETFLVAWKDQRALRDSAKLRPWLCAIARNLSKMAARKRGRDILAAAKPLEKNAAVPHPGPSPAQHAMAREEHQLMWEALEEIPEAYRLVLVLYYREGKSVRQVAECLGVSPEAAKQRLSRGRRMLKERVAAIVEVSLEKTKPTRCFTAAVVGALPGIAVVSAPTTALPFLKQAAPWLPAANPAGLGVLAAILAILLIGAAARQGKNGASPENPSGIVIERSASNTPLVSEEDFEKTQERIPLESEPDTKTARQLNETSGETETDGFATILSALKPGDTPEKAVKGLGPEPLKASLASTKNWGSIGGRIFFPDGRPAAKAWVRATPPSSAKGPDPKEYGGETNEEGWFDIDMPPGGYYLCAGYPGYAGHDAHCSASLRVKAGGDLQTNIYLQKASVVEGKIVELGSGAPLSGFMVITGGGRRAVSNADGSFAFDDLPPWDDTLKAFKEGWSSSFFSWGLGSGHDAQVLLEAKPAAEVCGKVTNRLGIPIPNALVSWCVSGMIPHIQQYAVRTDARGEYHLANLAPHRKNLTFDAEAPGYESRRKRDCVSFTPTERVVRVDFQLDRAPANQNNKTELRQTIRGNVTDQEGNPIANALLNTADSCTKTNNSGAFNLDTAKNNREWLYVFAPGYARTALPLENQRTISVVLEPAHWIGGKVVDPDGLPLARVLVIAGEIRAMTNADGRFVLEDMPAGVVSVRAVTFGDLGPGGTPAELEADREDNVIEVRTPPCHMSGRVLSLTSGKPVERFWVRLTSPLDRQRGDFGRPTRRIWFASEDGTFTVRTQGFFHADARVLVGVPGHEIQTLERVPIQSAARIDFDENTVYVSSFQRATPIQGIVWDEVSGLPIPGVRLSVSDTPVLSSRRLPFSPWSGCVAGRPWQKRTYTSEDGAFRFEPLGIRRGDLILERAGYGRVWMRDHRFFGETDLTMALEAKIQGRAEDAEGRPIPHAELMVHFYEGRQQIWNQSFPADERGGFAFAELAAGTYRIQVSQPRNGMTDWFDVKAGETYTVAWEPPKKKLVGKGDTWSEFSYTPRQTGSTQRTRQTVFLQNAAPPEG
jgi:RNA polymerase sigma factor (sigma-70 family)